MLTDGHIYPFCEDVHCLLKALAVYLMNILCLSGVLLYGPPGTGKTLLARACAAQTKSTFLKLAGPQLVQMFIGDGAKLVRDAFALAKEKAPAIIFIDELDAIGRLICISSIDDTGIFLKYNVV